jgi:hypothetical protein
VTRAQSAFLVDQTKGKSIFGEWARAHVRTLGSYRTGARNRVSWPPATKHAYKRLLLDHAQAIDADKASALGTAGSRELEVFRHHDAIFIRAPAFSRSVLIPETKAHAMCTTQKPRCIKRGGFHYILCGFFVSYTSYNVQVINLIKQIII